MKNKYLSESTSSNQIGDQYLQQKILSASSEQLVAYVYDAAISGCIKKDIEKVTKAIQVLLSSLDFGKSEDQKDIASNFYNTYNYLLDLTRKNKFDDVQEILRDLKESWTKAMKVY